VEITVGEIGALLEESTSFVGCSDKDEACERSSTCFTRRLWKETAHAMFNKLYAITLAEVIKAVESSPAGQGVEDVQQNRDGSF
jgi:DNA-binding IscR family transcriptional regulator